MRINDIKRILCIGAGTMGHQIGLLCAIHGYDVVIYDVKKEILKKAKNRIDGLLDKMIHIKKIEAESKDEIIGRIHFSMSIEEAAQDIDLVTESVPEDPEMKGAILSEFNKRCPERTLFTTNTSTLTPSMFANKTGRPEKVIALHFHDILITNVVDIMPHPGTSKETIELTQAFAETIKQNVILLQKENHGYVFNAMLSEFIKSALTLATNEVAKFDDIDRAWMGIMHTEVGPFGIIDSIGLDTVHKVVDNYAKMSKIQQLADNAALLKTYVDGGKLGIKAGEGFYTYPDPLFKQEGFL